MKTDSLTVMMARRFIKKASPEEMMSIVDTFMPIIVDALSQEQLERLLKLLFQKHLGPLLQGFDEAERARLLNELLPTIAREFPLHRIDFTQFFSTETE